ncbi:DUF305 domain-containing protein [Micromonospora sp. NPDC049366]|uniref:DUF305 domain-containing protein n=1 Tax=Micromonospora sp. NPDC049366 TaxID=3364271 RepID=UPI003796AEA8
MLAYPLATLGVVATSLAVASPASAHGYISSPPSRQALCASGRVAGCGQIQYEPQSVAGPQGQSTCNAGRADVAELNDDFRGWPATPVGTSVTFNWVLTAQHATSAAAATVARLAGCTAESEPPAPAPDATAVADGTYNDTDVAFLQMMVDHHDQGLELMKAGRSRATGEDVRMLADAMEATQATELRTITGWLTGWGKPVTVDHAATMHADHGALPISGVDAQASLRAAADDQFRTTFLNLLIAHQHNAVEMAKTELGGGANPQVKELASRVHQSYTEQIKQLLMLVSA